MLSHLTNLGKRTHRPTMLLALVAAIPLTFFAADMVAGAREKRPPTDDITAGLDHWPMQAALALAIFAVAALAACRLSGWRVSAWTAAAAAAWMGAFSVAYPQAAGGLGATGGWAAIGWSALLAASVWVESRHRV
jgi:hypothetical protein